MKNIAAHTSLYIPTGYRIIHRDETGKFGEMIFLMQLKQFS